MLRVGRPSPKVIVIFTYRGSLLYEQVFKYYRNHVNNNPLSTVDMIRVGGLDPRDSDKINSEEKYGVRK